MQDGSDNYGYALIHRAFIILAQTKLPMLICISSAKLQAATMRTSLHQSPFLSVEATNLWRLDVLRSNFPPEIS